MKKDGCVSRSTAMMLLLSVMGFIVAPVASLGADAEGKPGVNAAPNVVPAVQQWTGTTGAIAFPAAAIQVDAKHAAALNDVAKQLQSDLEALQLGKLEIVQPHKPAAGGLFMTLADNDPKLGKEGYRLDIGDQIVLSGNSATGVFYGTRTLLQMLLAHKSDRLLPKGVAVDYPDYAGRMLMIDVGRKPFPVPVLKDFIRIMAWYKMNELHLHLSDEAFGGNYAAFRVECAAFPGLAAKDLFYTKAELRELQDFAKARGITITPEIDMPGHARCFTNYWPACMLKGHPNYLDVTNPQTIERLKKLLDEMIPLFDAPDFHIGTDEYRVAGPDREKLHEAFRQFINTINAHIRSKGKNCRIWSGFEHMAGKTQIDPTVTIDMWETDDAKGQIAKGHKVINSNHGRTYIVPGCHYYGVSNEGIYGSWEPWMVSGDMTKNPAKDDSHLLGGKLHVWNDQGPTGYTHTEIADLALPSIQAFAEKLWGRKGSPDYAAFKKRAEGVMPIPSVNVLGRITPRNPDGLLVDKPEEQSLADAAAVIPLPLADADRGDLEYPWTLTMDVRKTAETGKRGVILSSDLAEICADYSRGEKVKTKGPDGKDKETEIVRRGIGVVRAAGSRDGADPASSHLARDVSGVYSEPLPLDQWTSVAIVGTRRCTTVYINGQKAGATNNQTLCPLRWLGSKTGNSFVGKVRNLKVYDHAISAKEIGRAAGVAVPDNLAEHCKVSATRTDGGFVPSHITDGDMGTRWSSGSGHADSATIDLGEAKAFNTVKIVWEHAYAKKYGISVSTDGNVWINVFMGEGRDGETVAKFPETQARFVRISGLEPATQWGYSIWEAVVCKQ